MTAARTEHTRDGIRRVARDMFAAQGFVGASMRDIARAVGIQGASLYSHFPSKEAILWDLTDAALDALEVGWERVDEELREASPADRLTGFVRAHVRYHAQFRREAHIINTELHRLSADHYRVATQRRADYESILSDLVRACLAEGGWSVPDLKVTVYAILEMGMAVATWYRDDGRLAIDELADIYAQLALKMLGPGSSDSARLVPLSKEANRALRSL